MVSLFYSALTFSDDTWFLSVLSCLPLLFSLLPWALFLGVHGTCRLVLLRSFGTQNCILYLG